MSHSIILKKLCSNSDFLHHLQYGCKKVNNRPRNRKDSCTKGPEVNWCSDIMREGQTITVICYIKMFIFARQTMAPTLKAMVPLKHCIPVHRMIGPMMNYFFYGFGISVNMQSQVKRIQRISGGIRILPW